MLMPGYRGCWPDPTEILAAGSLFEDKASLPDAVNLELCSGRRFQRFSMLSAMSDLWGLLFSAALVMELF